MELEQGNTEVGRQYLDRYLAELTCIGIGPNYDTSVAASELPVAAYLTGDRKVLDMAQAAADAVIRLGSQCVPHGMHAPYFHAFHGLALIAAPRGDQDKTGWLRRGLSEQVGVDIPGLKFILPRVLGLLDMAVGDADAAVAHFDQTLTRYRQVGQVPNTAWSCFECAEALLARGGEGDRERAAQLLQEGLAIAQRLDMRLLEERIRKLST
jgi:ATP/maltotriose-dependent transcriptional regulator MalT